MASTDEGRWLEGIQHPEQHDPLCPESWQPGYYLCICDRLRQAEQRGVKAARDSVAALPWKVAVSFGPIDCDRSCEHGPCVCSGVMRPEAWLTGPADALAAIDALTTRGKEGR